MTKSPKDETYSDAETARRRDAIIKNMIATPPEATHSKQEASPSEYCRTEEHRQNAKTQEIAICPPHTKPRNT
jgi:hypothetical protein